MWYRRRPAEKGCNRTRRPHRQVAGSPTMLPVSTNLSTARIAHGQVPPWPPPSTTSGWAPVRRANSAAAAAGVTGSRFPEITRAGMLEAGTRPHHFGRVARGHSRHTSANSSNGADTQLFTAGAGSSTGFSAQTIPRKAPTARPLSPRAKFPTAAATSDWPAGRETPGAAPGDLPSLPDHTADPRRARLQPWDRPARYRSGTTW